MRRIMERDFGEDGLESATAASCSPHPYEWSYFNKDVGCGGSASLYMYLGQQYPHLDFDGWNNRISCVFAACVNAWTTLYSCRNFQLWYDSSCQDPDQLFIYPGSIISDLNTRNFNNRTSSIRFCTVYGTCY